MGMANDRVEEVMQQAQDAFWAEVVKIFPSAKSGDFPPDATAVFNKACTDAIKTWAAYNVPRLIPNPELKGFGYPE